EQYYIIGAHIQDCCIVPEVYDTVTVFFAYCLKDVDNICYGFLSCDSFKGAEFVCDLFKVQ
ncbi:MAG: hypothetical protein K8R08_07575, partial [Methanosarcinales archaeon]|nr:hypothetical protein [Methanosarcinales archaeon]